MTKDRMVLIALLAIIAGEQTWSLAKPRAATLTPQDYNEIQQLYARYNWAIDTVDADAFTAVFTPDGQFGNNIGHDALANFIRTNVARDVAANHRHHWNSNMMLTATPEGAKGAMYLLAINSGTRPPTILGSFHYDDTLVRTPQGWRFKKRIVISDSVPAPGAPAAGAPSPSGRSQ
jgi:hypothetical protein